MKRLIPLAIALVALPGVTFAQADARSCGTLDQALPVELQPWQTAVTAGPSLTPGTTVNLTLRPIAEIEAATPPHPARQGATTGGRIELEIAAAGTYGVALGNAGWIDVVRNGQALESTAHGHGPACSTIRKIVNFNLTPGRYTIQISGTDASVVRLLVLPR